MTISKRSERRLIENEALFRGENEQITEGLERLADMAVRHGQSSMAFDASRVLHFYCECSNTGCEQRLPLSLRLYRQLHANRKRFTVLPGHQTPRVEWVAEQHDTYLVVEKYDRPGEHPNGFPAG